MAQERRGGGAQSAWSAAAVLLLASPLLTGCDADANGNHESTLLQRTTQALAPRALVEPCGAAGALRCRRIASSNDELLIGPARPALNSGGLVAFAGDDEGVPSILLGRGRALSAVDMSAFGLAQPARVALDTARRLAFLAEATDGAGFFGAFGSDRRGRRLVVHYLAEDGGGLDDGGAITSADALALAPNGTLAFSSIEQQAGAPDSGAVYRGPVRGSTDLVVSASDTSHPNQFGFSNVGALDVSSAGLIAAQMEHVTRCGIQNGVLVFDAPEPSLQQVGHAITGLSPGLAPFVAIDESGLVAFALPGTDASVMVLRCPPAGNFQTSFLATGVYTVQPTPFTVAPAPELVADVAGGFASFGAVDIAGGAVVFEAALDGGGSGVFRGADPVQDAVVLSGDELAGEVVSEVRLGQLNSSGELALLITSASGRSVWKVSGVAE